MATFIRPKGVKITDMCIYVDTHMQFVCENGANPQIENKIIEYLYHIVDSLAKKQSFFPRFSDYDEFALYSAGELFLSMRKKYLNAGKEVRGKVITPVKSCLNFTKSVLYPLKVNFQKSNYDFVLNPEIGQNTDKLTEDLRSQIRQQYQNDTIKDLEEILSELPERIYTMLSYSPYRNDPLMIRKLYLSIVLSFINSITLPNKIKNKLVYKMDNMEYEKLSNIYNNEINNFEILL
jgi:hypothetical protein